jgi:hypothetical protein
LTYFLESAFPDAHIFLKPALSLSNRIGSVTNIANAIKAKESVVNLATPQSDEAKAKIGKCMDSIIL